MSDTKPYSDNDLISTHWRIKTLKVFSVIFEKYKKILKPYDQENNELIKRELEKIDRMLFAFNTKIKAGEDDFDLVTMNFDGLYLKTLYSLVLLYKKYKEKKLNIEQSKASVRGAFEYKQKELNEITEILSLAIWQRVERLDLLIDDFELNKTVNETRKELKIEAVSLSSNFQFVPSEITDEFKNKQSRYNYKKLINLLEELNDNYQKGNAYSCQMLMRAILDHVPPLLGYHTFKEAVSNYTWQDTDKKYMENLLELKNEGNDALHRTISEDPDLLSMEDLPKPARFNRLLQECLKGGDKVLPKRIKIYEDQNKISNKKIDITLVDNEVKWASWALKQFVWSSFNIKLKVDNFRSKSPDYISVSLEGELLDGIKWKGKHFIFESIGKQDEELRIEQEEQQILNVYISNEKVNTQRQPRPVFKEDTFILKVKTKSGNDFTVPLKNAWISTG